MIIIWIHLRGRRTIEAALRGHFRMQLTLESDKQVWRAGEAIIVRLRVLNNSYDVATLDRRLLVGPNPSPAGPLKGFYGVSLEPSFTDEERNSVLLNPWCFYGRQRNFENLAEGQHTFYGYLLNRPVDSLLPEGPADADALFAAAEPLVLAVSAQ